MQEPTMSQRCSAKRRDGQPCNAWAVKDSDPPRCAAHGGTDARIGAPPGNTNALTHGFYAAPDAPPATIEEVIQDLAHKQQFLSEYITRNLEKISIEQLARLIKIHGQNASRLGRLLRDQRALSGEAADGISGAIAQALDELSTELGVPL
jgi:hypothetical protein